MRLKISFLHYTLITMLILSQLSCNSNSPEDEKEEENTETTATFQEKGFKKVICQTDETQSYEIYFPNNYNPDNLYPVIIVFDAHARGKMAVHKFKKSADEFGYIVVASNNAKNGLKTINNTINVLFNDVFYRYNIDKKRVYTAGFSGGAKVASSVAIYKGGIAGVIAMAGGLPKIGQEISHKFDYISIVGEEDFNLLELKALDKQMTKIGFPHVLKITSTGHEWPDEKTLNKSVEWFEIMSMKRGDTPVNDNLIRGYSLYMAGLINDLVDKGKVHQAKKLYEDFLITLDGLFNISQYQKSYEVLLKNPDVKIQQAEIKASDKIEADKQQEYIKLFKQQSFKQLSDEISTLKSDLQAKNEQKKIRAKRLLNNMSMLSFVFTEAAINGKGFKLAKEYLTIYKKVGTDNPDRYFFSACIHANQANNEKAIESLKQAVEFGFFDVSKLKKEDCFNDLRKLTEFEDILSKAKLNFEFF